MSHETEWPGADSAVPMTSFRLTVFTKSGGPLTKRISLNGDGSIKSDGSACVMVRGVARRIQIDSVGALAELIGELRSDQAIALGALRADLPERVEVTTKDKLNGGDPTLIARTEDFLRFEAGQPGFVLLDFDTKGMPPEVQAELSNLGGYWDAMVAVLPDLRGVGHVIRRSTSAGLRRADTGEQLKGSDGQHVYVAVHDGTDAERFLTTLHQRCWLRGLGWIMVGAGGQLLERSIIDRMVGRPERLVFEGSPVIEPPLVQDMAMRVAMPFDGGLLNTLAACPPLTSVEQQDLRKLIAKAKQLAEPEAKKAREAYVDERGSELAKRTGIPVEKARETIASQCQGILLSGVVLPFDDPELNGCTVGDVLDNPARFEGRSLADPIEGIEYGRCKAKVLRHVDGTPWIHSFAHGHTVYELKRTLEQRSADEIARLAQLPLAEYERERKAAARALGMRATVLDKLVQGARESDAPAADIFAAYEPSETSVEGDVLLRAIEKRTLQHIAADKELFTTAALWAVFAWTHDAFVHSPILLLTSKEPNSGKTTLLELLKYIVPRGLSSAEISAAALYRVIGKLNPTILVDEADTIFRQNDDLRQVINSGWTRGSGVIRCNPDTLEPELFPTFAPKVIGMKGLKLPDTTLSRSIVLTLKRKRRTDIVGDFMHQDDAELRNLRDQLARWAQDNIEKLRVACPALPEGFQNRLAANWRPMFAIADLCGGDWPERARSAARALSNEDVESLYVQALAAIQDMFDEQADMFATPQNALMFSRDIVKGLLAIEDGPWNFYAGKDRDKPITQNGLARLLKPIAPQTIRIGDKTAKGYYRHQFEDEFERYLGGGAADEERERSFCNSHRRAAFRSHRRKTK